jgi:hypothetical protein
MGGHCALRGPWDESYYLVKGEAAYDWDIGSTDTLWTRFILGQDFPFLALSALWTDVSDFAAF